MIRDACLSYFTPEEIINTLGVFPISPKVLDNLMPTNIGGDTLSGGSVRGEPTRLRLVLLHKIICWREATDYDRYRNLPFLT